MTCYDAVFTRYRLRHAHNVCVKVGLAGCMCVICHALLTSRSIWHTPASRVSAASATKHTATNRCTHHALVLHWFSLLSRLSTEMHVPTQVHPHPHQLLHKMLPILVPSMVQMSVHIIWTTDRPNSWISKLITDTQWLQASLMISGWFRSETGCFACVSCFF